jgi:hypothetical protein
MRKPSIRRCAASVPVLAIIAIALSGGPTAHATTSKPALTAAPCCGPIWPPWPFPDPPPCDGTLSDPC